MNRNVIKNAIKIYKRAYEYEQKIYKLIDMLTVFGGDTAYVEELGEIQGAVDNIIVEEFELNKINELDKENIMDEIFNEIKNTENIEQIVDNIVIIINNRA